MSTPSLTRGLGLQQAGSVSSGVFDHNSHSDGIIFSQEAGPTDRFGLSDDSFSASGVLVELLVSKPTFPRRVFGPQHYFCVGRGYGVAASAKVRCREFPLARHARISSDNRHGDHRSLEYAGDERCRR